MIAFYTISEVLWVTEAGDQKGWENEWAVAIYLV